MTTSEAPAAPAPKPRSIRRSLLRDIWGNLALALGAVQVQILHWALVVFRDGEGLSLWMMAGLTIVAMGINRAMLPGLRQMRSSRGMKRVFARAYMNLGIATLLLGIAVLASWVVLHPASLAAASVAPSLLGADSSFRATSGLLVSAVALSFLWGITVGRVRIETTRVRVAIEGLADSLKGTRILHLSDLHIGNGLEGRALERLVDRANALEPDLMVLTGDLFDHDPAFIEEGARALGRLRARAGIYVVLGNHDVYTGAEEVVAGLSAWAPDLTVLREEVIRLPFGDPLYLAGLDDPGGDWTARDLEVREIETLAERAPEDGPCILLCHRPEVFAQAARLGFPLMLAGHTHGGQIALPFAGGRINPSRMITDFDRGLFREGDFALYVNRGIGMAGPRIRFYCPREIAMIELV